MNTAEANTVLVDIVRRATRHLDGPIRAMQLGTTSDDATPAWDVENARVMSESGTETIVDLYQASDSDTDQVFELIRQPHDPSDTLSLDISSETAVHEMTWQQYTSLHRPMGSRHITF